jgi:hypothetical protein
MTIEKGTEKGTALAEARVAAAEAMMSGRKDLAVANKAPLGGRKARELQPAAP